MKPRKNEMTGQQHEVQKEKKTKQNNPETERFCFSAGKTAISLGNVFFSHQNEHSGSKES